jgi:hypothetical protein
MASNPMGGRKIGSNERTAGESFANQLRPSDQFEWGATETHEGYPRTGCQQC